MKTRRKGKDKGKNDKTAIKRSVTQIETKLRVDEATGHLKSKNYNKALSLYHTVCIKLKYLIMNCRKLKMTVIIDQQVVLMSSRINSII